uniref:F-box domain-containing protein n=1 Tax=Oryza rufipogon TaxID=4529 RepID=A0A0E0QBA7_ORYRU
MAAAVVARCGGAKKRKGEGLGEMHDDVLERVLARLPPASYFRLRGVCRRWSDAASSPTFLAACGRVPARDPWFLMLSEGEGQERRLPAVAFDAGEGEWARCGGAPGHVMPVVAASGGRVLYRAPDTGELTVANPLTGASRVLPAPPPGAALHAVAMYGSSPYRVVLITGDLPDLSMTVFDSSKNAWDDARSASRQYSSAVTCGDGGEAVAYFLSNSGAVVACELSRRAFAELPRILPVYFEYSIDVVACGGRAYVVVLSELLGTASLRLWEFAGGAWRQVAAMPPAMSHAFHGKKADVNCVGHGDRVMVCVSSGEANGCFMCDVPTNRWEELPPCAGAGGEPMDFVAAFSFEPRMEVTV